MKRFLYLTILLTVLAFPGLALGAPGEIHSESGIDNLSCVVEAAVKVLLAFVPGVATLYLIMSGYRYIIAQGNQDLTEKAKKSLTYAVFGVLVTYSAVAVIATVSRSLGYNL